jgi:hypothetical protein
LLTLAPRTPEHDRRASKAIAAFEGRSEVALEDIYRWVAAPLSPFPSPRKGFWDHPAAARGLPLSQPCSRMLGRGAAASKGGLLLRPPPHLNLVPAATKWLRLRSCFSAFPPHHIPAVHPPPLTPKRRVIPLCLRHRLRKDPLADIDSGDKVREVFKAVFGLE